MNKRIVSYLVILLIIISNTLAIEQIIINSEDWKDVYSGMLYGSLTGTTANFLVSDKHSTLILGTIPNDVEINAISSRRQPFIVGYESLLQSRGYSATENIYESPNLALAEELDLNRYVIIDESYGYNAVSVAPYAVVSDSYVLFTDRRNVDDIDDFLSGRDIETLIIYGQVDREVRETLSKYDPEIINFEGDRFANNIEIVKRYMNFASSKQVVLTNGEFIEREIMSGTQPVIFIGANNVPDQVRDYIQSSDIDVGVLVGNELVATATYIRRNVGISVFVKFAQGARSPGNAISQVEALDMFYLPVYSLNIEIDSVRYNRATNQLEINIKNTEEQAVYFKGSYSIIPTDSDEQKAGDIDSVFLDGNELKTMVYDVEPMPDGKITLDAYVIYGESKGSLEKVIDLSLEVSTVEVFDSCELDLVDLVYDKGREEFLVGIQNIGEQDCYVDVEILDLDVDGITRSYGADDVIKIREGKKSKQKIEVELEDEDIEENDIVTVRAYYGERENSLVKVQQKDFEMQLKGVDYVFYTLLLVIIILLILIILKRRKDKEE